MKNFYKIEAFLLSLTMIISAHQNKDIILNDDEILTKPNKETIHYLKDKEKYGNNGFSLKRVRNNFTRNEKK